MVNTLNTAWASGVDTAVQPKQQRMDTRFVTWNVQWNTEFS